MTRALLLIALTVILGGGAQASPRPAPHKLLVISVDGLDWRYLRDADALGLKIPNLRKLAAEGEAADGVVGVAPTITWPSHTSIITGVRPDQHGVTTNARLGAPLTESVWSTRVLKVPTLYDCVAKAGRTSAAITWPTTVDANVTWNLPEYFLRRNGGSMDLKGVAQTATPGLVDAIAQDYPSFRQQWVDDRTRALATLHLLRKRQPDLILLHFVDLDSEAHDQGPFETNANAILERTDELIGDFLRVLPADYRVAVVSDHGFERVDRVVNPRVLLAQAGVQGQIEGRAGLVVTTSPAAAAFLRQASGKPETGVGREVPFAELARFVPDATKDMVAFEPAPHTQFGRGEGADLFTAPHEKGAHGFWPLRANYRSTYVLWGPGVKPRRLPELDMLDLKDRLAAAADLSCGN